MAKNANLFFKFFGPKVSYLEQKLPLEKRWSARYFSLDKIFKPVILEEVNVKNLEWFYDLSSWENYTNFFTSKESKTIKRPYEGLIKYHEWSGIGVDNDNDEE